MMVAAVHRLILVDRGVVHRHRWDATCVCGWTAVHRRRKRDAVTLFREHVEGKTSGWRRRKLMANPRTPTAAADLPETLR
jgi:hypothetical protein